MKNFRRSEINGVLGSTFITSGGVKLLIERDLGDDLLHVITLPGGATYRVEDPQTGEMTLPDKGWLERELAEGMRKVGDANGPVAPVRAAAALHDPEEILSKDPYAAARLRLMLTLLEHGVDASDPRLSQAIDSIWDASMVEKFGRRPPTSTVRTWFSRCREESVELADMMSMSGRVPRRTRLNPFVEEIIEQERPRYWANRGTKQVDVLAAVVARLVAENLRRKVAGESELDMPGKETVRRRITEMECRETYAEKFGEKAARRKYDGSGRGLHTSRILQVALMDDTVVDMVTCLDADRAMVAGRPHLCVIMDAHSRVILGLVAGFEPPTVHTAAQCLRLANAPKLDVRPDRRARYPALCTINGKPAKIVTDNGANYAAPGFTEMLLDLGIAHELTPVGAPRHKATIERFFRTFNTFLIDKLPGATLDPSVLRKLGIDPTSEAVVTITELKELIGEFLYLYHITHHSGIDAAPLDKWHRGTLAHGRDLILDTRKLEIVTGVTVHRKRVTANGGVRMFGMQWKGENLPDVVNKLVAKEPHSTRLDATVAVTTKVKYNPEDMLYVHVFVGDDWLRLENTQPDYSAGLSLWQHRQIKEWAQRQSMQFSTVAERLVARDELNRTIRETFPDMNNRERRAMARMVGADPTARPAFDVSWAEAEHRHDGLGPVIEHQVPAEDRPDAYRVPSRPGFAKSVIDDEHDEDLDADDGDADTAASVFRPARPIIEPSQIDDDEFGDEEYR
ncbi:DDE-type integrase/transposase/recombinase [Sphingomonas sp. AX6]|uniref:DDE-type integrase/transposase/recombinase n=1 Tax=Sphingomonas sp. AX6 TaxID=2653171 RepID=UPI0012F0FFED|nr:DDE-type integrase/transposase/recombinase [Sphingomonas sp. AX6]VXC84638.1 transposase [Sphingomonas sp. AX6]